MSRFSSRPRLLDTTGVLLPSPTETFFLKTCLGVKTEESWRRWQADEPKLKSALARGKPAYNRLLPLLFHSLASDQVAVDDSDLAVLRLAAMWEERRSAKINSILAGVLQALAEESVEPVVSKGVALAHLAYPKESLRHCHDIDLLVPADRLEPAAEVLQRIGFSPDRPKGSRRAAHMLVHEDGLPVSLHVDLPLAGGPGAESAEAMGRVHRVELAGLSARVLEPTDLIALMAAQLLTGQARDRTSWVVDAAFLLRQSNVDDSEWRALADRARNWGLSIPILAMLSYLNSEFEIAVPDAAFGSLSDQADREPAQSRDRFLALLRRNPGVHFGDMVRSSGWHSRLDLARWVVLPSSPYLRAWCQEKGLPWSRAWYVARPFRRLLLRAVALFGPGQAAASDGEAR